MAQRTAFVGGQVFDGRRYVGATEVLVQDGRIREVGRSVDRAEADVVDIGGGLLAPGFVDAHIHPVVGGLERVRCDLSGLERREDYLDAIARYAARNPQAPWILGGGWSMAAFPGGNPTASELDRIVADRPVFLPNRDRHSAWVNSRAFELAGIDDDTPDPRDGRLERDSRGHLTGAVHEGAMSMIERVVPVTTEDESYAALLEAQRYLHSLGITGWQDARVGTRGSLPDVGPVYLRALAEGELTASVTAALLWDRAQGLEQIESFVSRREAYSRGRFQATTVKIMQDGTLENGSAAMLMPYLDASGQPSGNAGHSFLDPVTLREAVSALDALGFQVHVHAIGDRGVREALDAFAGTDRSRRHQIAHVQVVHPDDRGRFASLGVAVNAQMLWACLDGYMVDLTLPVLGEERSGWQYPFGDLARAGARLVAGSDWPVSTPDPLAAMSVGVRRLMPGAEGRAGSEPFLPEQAIPLEAAMAAYTRGSAWASHRDDAGTIRPGAVADLVMLAGDPFLPGMDVAATSVSSTWIDGVPVYDRATAL